MSATPNYSLTLLTKFRLICLFVTFERKQQRNIKFHHTFLLISVVCTHWRFSFLKAMSFFSVLVLAVFCSCSLFFSQKHSVFSETMFSCVSNFKKAPKILSIQAGSTPISNAKRTKLARRVFLSLWYLDRGNHYSCSLNISPRVPWPLPNFKKSRLSHAHKPNTMKAKYK